MRIAFHVPRASYLKPGASGDKTYVRNYAAGLTALGHQVRFVSQLNVRDLWRGRQPARRMVSEALRVRRQMKSFGPDAWLVYATSVTDPDLFGWWQCRGPYVLIHARGGHGHRLSRAWRWLFRFAHRRSLVRADSVAAERPPHLDELRHNGVPTARLSFLPPSAGGLGPLPSRDDARARLALPSEATVALCVTRLPPLGQGENQGKTKGVLDLLRGFSELPTECMLLLVGGGEGRAWVEEEIARLGIAPRVRFVGSVPHHEIGWFYAACDFYAYPLAEDRPFVALVEAQTAGRPVVAMRSPSTEAIVADRQSGLLAGDLHEFGTQMAALATDRTRCASMGHAAHEYATAHHSTEARAKQIEALLRGTATRRRRRRRRWRRRWERYLQWPAPLWRLRGYAQLQLEGHEFKFYVENVTVSWARKVWRSKWEKNATAFLKDVLRAGDVFFDVGAWAGPFSLLAARLVQPGGSVYAFEPDPVARRLLERHVAANHLSNVTVLPYAVTDHEGAAWLASPRLGDSQSWVDPEHGLFEIETVSLQGFCERQGIQPDVIKIDVEGAEAQAVAGGTEVLRKSRAIVIELHDPKLRALGVDPATFRRSLDDLGKQVTVLHDRPDAGVSVLGLS